MITPLINKIHVYVDMLKRIENDTIANDKINSILTNEAEAVSRAIRADLENAPPLVALACIELLMKHLDLSRARLQFKLMIKSHAPKGESYDC